MTMLDAVYVECRDEKQIVAIEPKPAFRPLFEVVTTKQGSGIVLISGDPLNNLGKTVEQTKTPSSHDEGVPGLPCFWWRRGRVFWTQSINGLWVIQWDGHLDANVISFNSDKLDEKSQESLTLIFGQVAKT